MLLFLEYREMKFFDIMHEWVRNIKLIKLTIVAIICKLTLFIPKIKSF